MHRVQSLRVRQPPAQECLQPVTVYTGAQFDAVMGLEIIEHVEQPQQFLKTLGSLTKSDGALFISTINRTLRGYALAILGAEYIAGVLPKGTHDWNKFLTPGTHHSVHVLCFHSPAGQQASSQTMLCQQLVFAKLAVFWHMLADMLSESSPALDLSLSLQKQYTHWW